MVRDLPGSASLTDELVQDASSAVSLRFMLLGDTGVGKTAFVDAFLSTLTNVVSRERIRETIAAPLTSAQTTLPEIRVHGVRARATPVLQPESTSPFDDPLGLVPPRLRFPAREVTFLDLPGYSSTTNPQSTLTLTDNYLNHHLHSITSIFSPTISSQQLAWFLITGSRAHSLPTCAFYFVLYELKPIDILYMKMLHERVNLVPVLIKTDTLPKRDLWVLKKRLVRQLKMNGIQFHTFGLSVDEIEARIERRQWGGAPFAISAKRDETGRLYDSELEHLVHLCLYSQVRPLQEEGARKVISWKRDYGPKVVEHGKANGYEQAWREKSSAPSPVAIQSPPPLNIQLPGQQTPQSQPLQLPVQPAQSTQSAQLTSATQPEMPGFSTGNYSTPVYTPQTTYSSLPTATPTPGSASSGVTGYFMPPSMASPPVAVSKSTSTSGQSITSPSATYSIYGGYTVPPSFPAQQQQQTVYSPPPPPTLATTAATEASATEADPSTKALPMAPPPSLATTTVSAAFMPPPPSAATAVSGPSISGVSSGIATRVALPGGNNYSPPPVAAAAMVITSRQEVIENETGLTVDSSERPNVIMDTPGLNTVHATPLGQQQQEGPYYISPPGAAGVDSVEMINPDGTRVKVEIPNSGKSFHPAPSEIPQQLVTSLAGTNTITNTTTILSPFAGPGSLNYFDPTMAAFLQPTLAASAAVAPPANYQFVETDIWEAAESGDVAAVQAHLMNGANPDQRNNSRSTLLHRTAWQGSNPYEVMKLLISYNANVNLTNENGNTVLQNVLMKHDDPRLIKLLLDNGADTSITNKEGMNTLEVAALFHRLDSARFLLENDFASSEPSSIQLALNRAKSPDKKAMKALLRSWQGSEGDRKRAALVQRLNAMQAALAREGVAVSAAGGGAVTAAAATATIANQHHQQPSSSDGQQAASSSANSAHGSTAVASDSASVRSFEGAKEQGKPGSKPGSVYQEGSEHMRTSSVSLGKNSAGRFNLKNMRAAAPSMTSLFSRKG